MKRKLTALSSVTALVVAALATYSAVSASVAAEGDGYSTDPSNPTLVTTVPDGFTPYGDPVITTDNDVTTTKQVYSRTIKGNSGVFTAWQPAGFSEWSRDSAQPADPDGQLGDDNPLNLKMVGTPMETRTVTDQEATQGHYTDWVNQGEQVRTEEKVPPGEDSDLVRWVYVGEVDGGTTVVTEAQHYSLKGNSGIGKDDVPVFPADYWQENAGQEPPGHYGSAQKPDGSLYTEGSSGLHYTSAGSSGNRDWFYFKPEVTCPDTDYLWQQQVREWEPGTPAVTHDEFRWPLLSRTYTPGTADVTEYVYTVDAVSPETVTSNSPHGTAPNEAQAPKPPKPPVHATVPTTIDAGR